MSIFHSAFYNAVHFFKRNAFVRYPLWVEYRVDGHKVFHRPFPLTKEVNIAGSHLKYTSITLIYICVGGNAVGVPLYTQEHSVAVVRKIRCNNLYAYRYFLECNSVRGIRFWNIIGYYSWKTCLALIIYCKQIHSIFASSQLLDGCIKSLRLSKHINRIAHVFIKPQFIVLSITICNIFP